MATDFDSEGLLEGLDGRAREARLELLEKLEADGVSLGRAARCDPARACLPLVPVDRALGGGEERYTRRRGGRALRRRGHVPRPALASARHGARRHPASPPTPRPTWRPARRVKSFRDAGPERRGTPRDRAGDAAAPWPTSRPPWARCSATPSSAGRRRASTSRCATRRPRSALTPTVGPCSSTFFGVQQRNQIRQAAMDGTALSADAGPGAEELSFCFADLVGFTKPRRERRRRRSSARSPQRLEELAHRGRRPSRAAGQDDRRRRDAELARTPTRCLSAALAPRGRRRRAPTTCPSCKAGVARGEALGRAGDWYGRPVNLASRVTAIARPGSVLVEEAAHLAAEGDYQWSFAGGRKRQGRGRRGQAVARARARAGYAGVSGALAEPGGLAQGVGLAGLLPGEVVVLAAEVAVGGGLLVDRPVQVQLLAEGARTQVEVLVDQLGDAWPSTPSRCRRSRPSPTPGAPRRWRRPPAPRSGRPGRRPPRSWPPSGRRTRRSGPPSTGPCRRRRRRRGGRRRRRCPR